MRHDWFNAGYPPGQARRIHRDLSPKRFASAPVILALLTPCQHVFAQQPIGAGGQIQQIPPALVPEKPVPKLPIPRQQAPAAPVPSGASFAVRSLHVTGQTQFSETELIAATAFKPDSKLTLPELRGMAASITSY